MGRKEREELLNRLRYDVGNLQKNERSDKKSNTDAPNDDPNRKARERERGGYERKINRKDYYETEVKSKIPAAFKEKPEGKKRDLLVEKLIYLESKFLNIEEPHYLFYHYNDKKDNVVNGESQDGYGGYEDSTDTIHINLDYNVSYWELFDTIIHELRHKYQSVIMQNPEEHPEVRKEIENYLCFSEATYPRDEGSKTYEKEYWENGLEIDTFAYAAGRMEIYSQQIETLDELFQMDSPIKNVSKNQILMKPGETDASGKQAPILVGKTFDSAEFKEYQSKNNTKIGDNKMGERTNTVDFSENAQNEAIKVYGMVIESIQTSAQNVVDDLTKRINLHPHRQLEKMINTFVDAYNEKLPKEIKGSLQDWKQSENSFVAALRKEEEELSPASENAARKVEDSLGDILDETHKAIDSVKIDKPVNANKEEVMADADFVNGCITMLCGVKDTWEKNFETLCGQNSLYSNLWSLVVDTFKRTEELYAATEKDISGIGDSLNANINDVKEFGKSFATERNKIFRDKSAEFTATRKRI